MDELTPREIETLRVIAANGCIKNCVKELGVTSQTIKNRIYDIHKKMNVGTTIQAVYLATKKGVI